MSKSSNSRSGSAKVRKSPVECFYVTLRGLEYLHAQRVLEMCGHSRAKAARVLRVERAALPAI
jgi:hypothetical protein